MGKSYRKHKFIKCGGDTSYKKIFNRKIRRSKKDKFTDIPSGKAYRKVNCPWEIADYRCRGVDSWIIWQKEYSKYYSSEEKSYIAYQEYNRLFNK